MALEKGLYGKITGLEDLANENIVGVQFNHGEQGNTTIESQEGAEFSTVGDFVQMVDDNNIGAMFDNADNASVRPDPSGEGQILALSRNVGSNG